MPHGGPDWGTGGPLGTVYTIEDMAELAVRLGSIVTFDRRGNVIWMDDFESGIDKWIQSFIGGDGVISWDSTNSRNGAFSCKLATKAAANASAQIGHDIPFPVISDIGLEYSIARGDNICNIYATIHLYDGDTVLVAQVRYSTTTNKLQYRDHTYVFQDTGIEVEIPAWTAFFNTIKLVVDFDLKEYKRLTFNNQTVDLSGKAMWEEDDNSAAHLHVAALILTGAAVVATAYVDDVIVTQNEP